MTHRKAAGGSTDSTMGAWFSFPGNDGRAIPREWAVAAGLDATPFNMCRLKNVGRPGPRTPEEFDAYHIRNLARWALQHYNSSHLGAEFRCPDQPTTEAKAACVGFREDLWYHLNFLACLKDDGDEQSFFAELRYVRCSSTIIIETCTILEKPFCPFRSSCTLCPDESKILHPSDVELGCGKEGHQEEFFRERCGWNGHVKEFFSPREMLAIPFKLGGPVPRYRLE